MGGSEPSNGGTGGVGAGGPELLFGGAPSKAGSTGFVGKSDTREPVKLAKKPPATQGGTLLALRKGGAAFVADPDRDRVLLIDTVAHTVMRTIPLGAGAEPGRAVEDSNGLVHVVLRGSGEVATIDVANAELLTRRAVCAAPRGIVLHPQRDALVVACAEGSLVELPTAEGDATAAVSVDADLRDIVVQGGNFAVTRFRSAEILTFDPDYQLLERRSIEKKPGVGTGSPRFESEVAWRTVPGPNGSLVVVHQRATTESIFVSGNGTGVGGASGLPDSGAAGEVGAGAGGEFSGGFFSGYSSGGPCEVIVQSAVSSVDGSGAITTSGLMGMVLPVDVAVSPDGLIAVASGGAADPMLRRTSSTTIGIYTPAMLFAEATSCVASAMSLAPAFDPASAAAPADQQVVAVAFDPVSGELLAQAREPAAVRVIKVDSTGNAVLMNSIALGGESAIDTGHEIFNRDAGSGIACASCHPEGTDDGHVWHFQSVGPRRTQSLDVGLAGSEPFHWAGDLPNLTALMSDVFVGRMGGPQESDARVEALKDYIFALPRRAAVRAADDAAALRGQVLFESEATGCVGCHSGPTFTNNVTFPIGKGPALQVPSLIAVSRRLPLMHDGCAKTLLDRFDPACGGTAHGDVSSLSTDELDDLVAYLESL